ncbi:MAG: hypothetical protein NC900_02195 [Candidatus Omnitrophica bacterium]|nr:hypothetical protein [Candidatus Omnitrophota bacterium]
MRYFFKKGFSLLELTISIGILILVISSIYVSLVYCLILNESNYSLTIASNDAQRILEQIRQLPFDEIQNYIPTQFNNLKNETVTVDKDIEDRIAKINVTVSWDERNRKKNFSLLTKIAR